MKANITVFLAVTIIAMVMKVNAVEQVASNLPQAVYPIKVEEINQIEAHYKTPENTIAAAVSALRKHDLKWFYQSFTVETAIEDQKNFKDANIDLSEKFKLVAESETFIIDKIPYKDGLLLLFEKRVDDMNGSRLRGEAAFIQEDGLWKITYKYARDEELEKYSDVVYVNCIASYSFSPSDFTEDSCWHDNNLNNLNKTKNALDKRYEEDLAVAVLNGIDNGFTRDNLNDMPRKEFSMGGWIKAEQVDHSAGIIEIGRDDEDSTAIVLDAGGGLRYWVHVNGKRVERNAAMDYDLHDNQWHHVYLTYDGKLMKLYVDAQIKDSQPVQGSIDSVPIINIGQRNSALHNETAEAFKGRIDDIQIYNKALKADEILKKYENGTTQSI